MRVFPCGGELCATRTRKLARKAVDVGTSQLAVRIKSVMVTVAQVMSYPFAVVVPRSCGLAVFAPDAVGCGKGRDLILTEGSSYVQPLPKYVGHYSRDNGPTCWSVDPASRSWRQLKLIYSKAIGTTHVDRSSNSLAAYSPAVTNGCYLQKDISAILARRIIPCLDVRDGAVVKGVRFRGHRVAGDILELARRYRDEGADELVFYDITASPEGRSVDREWVRRVAEVLDIPFCVAGGIRSVADAEVVLNAGADKISVNSPVLDDPALIDALSIHFGSQCVVVGIDGQRTLRGFRAWQWSGDPDRARDSGRAVLDWVQEVQERGAGEIVLNCMANDGVRRGYDLEQLSAARSLCSVPLVASGGAGAIGHFTEVFREARVDGALAASVFHSGEIRIPALKAELRAAGVPMRFP